MNLPIKIGRERTFVVSYKKQNMDKLFSSSLLWDTAEPFHYIRSFAGNRLWVGGEDVAEESYTPSSDKRHIAALNKYSREILALDSSYVLEKKKSWSGVFSDRAWIAVYWRRSRNAYKTCIRIRWVRYSYVFCIWISNCLMVEEKRNEIQTAVQDMVNFTRIRELRCRGKGAEKLRLLVSNQYK